MRRYNPRMKKLIAAVSAVAAIGSIAGCTSGDSKTTVVTTTAAPVTVTTENAASQDATFVAQVSLIDGVEGSKTSLVEMGRNVCKAVKLDKKIDVLQILNESYGIEAAASFMHTSMSVYCPEELVNG